MKAKFYSLFFVAASFLLLESCQKQDIQPEYPTSTNNYSSAVATDWMNALRQVVQSESKNPPQASRVYAYGAVSLYQAVLPGMSDFQSLEGQIEGLSNLPVVSQPNKLDYTTAANEAMYQFAKKIFGTLKTDNIQLIEQLHQKYHSEAVSKIATDKLEYSEAYGNNVAMAVLNRADNDGFAATRTMTYTVPLPSANPANWQPTGAVTSPLEPYWGTLKCFAMANGGACTIKSAIPFSTDPNSQFYKQALEVATVGSNLSQEQKAIANWWADGSGATPTPPGHWVGIASGVIADRNMNLTTAAEVFATLNMAMADAFISCWDEKFKCNLLRPVTFIRQNIPGQSSWSPLLATPPFPEYPSGHSVSSGAAADILTKLLGNLSFTDKANVSLGLQPRSFNSFQDAAQEAAISRLYGGIHYREAIENGILQGKEVAKAVFSKLKLRR